MADRIWVACANGTREKLEKLIGTTGSLNKLCAAALEALANPSVVHMNSPFALPSVSRTVTLDEACEALLRVIDESQAALIRALSRESSQPASTYILSYIKLAHERGETGVVMQEVMAGHAVSLAPPGSPSVCEFCGNLFSPARLGQRFCPDPDDGVTLSCGKQAHLKEVHAKRRRELDEKTAQAMRETL